MNELVRGGGGGGGEEGVTLAGSLIAGPFELSLFAC